MPCLSGSGYQSGETERATAQQTAAMILGAEAAVFAVDNAMQLIKNYNKQKAVAKRANAIKKAYQNMLATTFWPRDTKYLNEFANSEVNYPVEDVEVMGRRYAGRLVSMVAKKFADLIKEAKCNLSRYCTSANKKTLQDLLLARSNAIASARMAGRQMAFKEGRARIDVNFKRRHAAVSLGEGLIAEASSLYAAAGQAYAAIGNNLAAQFNSNLGQLGAAVGAYSSASTRLDSLQNMRQDNTIIYGPTSFGVANTWDSMYGSGNSNTFESYRVGASPISSMQPNAGLSTVYSSNGEAVLNGSQLINQRDLARSGSYTYVVEGIPVGTVTVNMGDFQLHDYAEYDHGDQPI